MKLFHFTSSNVLRPIAKHGLTVGDVPTDMRRFRAKVGVWLTSESEPDGHGLEGSRYDKTRYRLTVELDESDPLLKRWSEWSRRYATKETRKALHETAPNSDAWFVYFGHIPPDAIRECTDTRAGVPLPDWGEHFPEAFDVKPVRFNRRAIERWHKKLNKDLKRALRRQ